MKLKTKVRIIIESFFEPVGTLVSAFLLTTVTLDSWILSLFFAIILIFVSLGVRAYYPKAILCNEWTMPFTLKNRPKSGFPLFGKKSAKLQNLVF